MTDYRPAHDTTAPAEERDDESSFEWLRTSWPLGGRQWIRLAVALAAVVALFSLVGLAITDWLAPNFITDTDVDVAQSLADGRTDFNNDLSHIGSFPADTPIKIGASVLIAAAMMWRWRRWHEAVFVGLTLIFEASAYLATSIIVGRPRPDVERLASSPVDTSFPSGHVAAATVYGALAVIVFWHNRSTVWRTIAVGLSIALAVFVAWARLYKGMHFLSDVTAGIALGALSILICYQVLGPPRDAIGSSGRESHTNEKDAVQ